MSTNKVSAMTLLELIHKATLLALNPSVTMDELTKLIQSADDLLLVTSEKSLLNGILTNISALADEIVELETDLEVADELSGTAPDIDDIFEAYYLDTNDIEEIELFDVNPAITDTDSH